MVFTPQASMGHGARATWQPADLWEVEKQNVLFKVFQSLFREEVSAQDMYRLDPLLREGGYAVPLSSQLPAVHHARRDSPIVAEEVGSYDAPDLASRAYDAYLVFELAV